MATLSSGVTASFDGVTLAEVYNVSADLGGGASTSRSKSSPFSANGGTLSFEMFGSAGSDKWGKYGTLTIGGGGINLTCTALCTSVGFAAQVNDAVRRTMTFQVIQ